jgi:hypothetical protein
MLLIGNKMIDGSVFFGSSDGPHNLSQIKLDAIKFYAATGCVTQEYMDYVLGDQMQGVSLYKPLNS